MDSEIKYSEEILRISKEVGLPPDTYIEIRVLFFQNTIELIGKLDSAFQSGKLDDVVFLAHSIKGSALNYRYSELADNALSLEDNARNGEFSEAENCFKTLKKTFEKAYNETKDSPQSEVESKRDLFIADNKFESSKSMILIVDDIPANVDFLVKFLDTHGYKVASCNDGKQALDFVKNIIPDLILLDIMMPEIDGFQVCEELKKNPNTDSIPVIFLTARADTNSIIKGFDVGGKDFLTKPFNSSELLVRVKTQITLKNQILEIQRGKAEIEKERQISETKNELFANFLRLSGKLEVYDLTKEIGDILKACPGYKFTEYFRLEPDMVFKDLSLLIFEFIDKCALKVTTVEKNNLLNSIKLSVKEKNTPIHQNINDYCFHISYVSSKGNEEELNSNIQGFLVAVSKTEPDQINSQKELFKIVVNFTSVVEDLLISNQRLKQLHKVEYEFKAAEEIQRSLLPESFPDSEIFDIYGINKSYGSVGGDFFNIFKTRQGKIGCCIADVSGKGLPAALMATSIWTAFIDVVNEDIYDHGALYNICNTMKKDHEAFEDAKLFDKKIISTIRPLFLDEIFRKLNNHAVITLHECSFVTMTYVLLDEQNRSFDFVNAGHFPLLTYNKKSDEAEFIELPSIPLGIISDMDFPSKSISLESGDIILLYTDGVIEAQKTDDFEDELFGEDRLKQKLVSISSLSAKEITEEIHQCVQNYSLGHLSDDLTIVTIKVK